MVLQLLLEVESYRYQNQWEFGIGDDFWMDVPGTLHISGATPTNSINFSSGTITFDTTHAYWHHTSGVHGTGVIEEKEDDGLAYSTCSFTFDSINLESGLTVKLEGKNSLILKTRNHGNISVGTTLSANGGDSDTTYPAYLTAVEYGVGKLGGANGGLKILPVEMVPEVVNSR